MIEPAQPLDTLTVPLWGSRLIEASAGTGKTWTLAALVLRLVLGHGGSAGFSRPLPPSQILVMTFTRAATRELSDRIRERLVEAAACLRGEQPATAGDTLLQGLMTEWPDGPLREQAAWRAALAAEAMDEAAVHTIDAWCQRMLREHAFDSGCLFDEDLQPDESVITAEAARDHWRQEVVPLSADALALVLTVWPTVDRMATDVLALVPHADAFAAPQAATLGVLCADLLQQRRAALSAIKCGWAARVADLRQWFGATLQLKPCPFNQVKVRMAYVTPWLDALQAWANDPQLQAPALKADSTAWKRLTPGGIAEALNGKAPLAMPPALSAHLQACAELRAQLDTVPDPGPPIRRHAAVAVAARVQALKAQAGTYGFADLLVRLDAALAGPRGTALRDRIVAQYPVALVDEFQDTSPIQYRILDRLYRVADPAPDTALFLIGDPKQSIYGFRGADIRSYLRAREATAGRHLVLGTNYRSTVELVGAVNHLYGGAEQRPGDGAFAFRECDRSGDDAPFDPLPFLPVAARGRPERFTINGAVQPALTLVHDDVLRTGALLQQVYGERCAEHIVGLLNAPDAAFTDPADGDRRVRPADIAVLVRTGREAAAVRRALMRRGVMSVYLSDRDSVFAGPEAADLQHWLRAVADPLDARRVRAALASSTIGLSLPELLQIATDERTLEAHLLLMTDLQAIWRRQGVLAMLRQTLHRLSLPQRWRMVPGGERRLTNLLHLAELLQAASARLDGEHALMRWLAEQCDAAVSGTVPGDDQLVRLESDADLVQVVTVHKSKGLEYPVVCLPFATSLRPAAPGPRGYVLAPGDGTGPRRPLFAPDGAALQAADRERLQEDLRLLYVALTRARHALWLGIGALQLGQTAVCTFDRSALGHLLTGGHEVAADEIGDLLRFNFGHLPGVRIEAAPDEIDCTMLQPSGKTLPLTAARRYEARFDRSWAVGSFSSLVASLASSLDAARPSSSGESPASSAASSMPTGRSGGNGLALLGDAVVQQELMAEAADESLDDAEARWRIERGGLDAASAAVQSHAAPDAARARAAAPWHRFPRGALAGNFLHAQLQWLAERGFASPAADPALARSLRERCERMGYGAHAEDVGRWLEAVLSTPLPPLAAALPQLPVVRAELEFWMPAQQLSAARIDALCRQHLLAGRPRPTLPQRSLHGMVMGFADLVFEHQGRWWVLDYKSNALGVSDAAYDANALAAAVAAHRYDVQAALYQLALHRLLRQRLGTRYDPARDLGGAIVLFLRGIRGPEAGCCHLPAVLPLLQALDGELAGSAP